MLIYSILTTWIVILSTRLYTVHYSHHLMQAKAQVHKSLSPIIKTSGSTVCAFNNTNSNVYGSKLDCGLALLTALHVYRGGGKSCVT